MEIKDKNKVKVSVVVITYNQEKTIGRTLDSILGQVTDFPYEIIIGDDASQDSTEQICRQYAEKHPDIIRYVRNESNKGLMHNYYDCLLMAQGEYIADVAGDDFWIYPEKLQQQVDILDGEKNVVLVCTDWLNFNEDSKDLTSPWGEKGYPFKDWFKSDDFTFKLLNRKSEVPVHLCTSMYRRNSFLNVYNNDPFVFRHKEFIIEDVQLIIMLSTVGEFRFLDMPTLAYSVNEKSFTGNKDLKKQFDLYYGSLILNRYLAVKLQLPKEKFQDKYNRVTHFLLMQAFHAEDKERADKIKKVIKDWELRPGIKTWLIINLTSNKISWKISKSIWQMLKSLPISP